EGQQKYAAAERELTELLKQPDVPSRVWFIRANVRRRAGNPAGATADLAAGLKTPARDAMSLNARGLARLNGFSWLKSDPVAALAGFEEALRLDPRRWEAMQNKALVLADHLNRPRDAVTVLDQLLALDPDSVEARAGRGVYRARLGERELALRDADDTILVD